MIPSPRDSRHSRRHLLEETPACRAEPFSLLDLGSVHSRLRSPRHSLTFSAEVAITRHVIDLLHAAKLIYKRYTGLRNAVFSLG